MTPIRLMLALALGTLLLAACAAPLAAPPTAAPTAPPTPLPPPTATPDPCAPENLQASIVPVDRLMREFDDASYLAQNIPVGEAMVPTIADLQRLRRQAEELELPICLMDLRTYQVAHMNQVLDILIFTVNQGQEGLRRQETQDAIAEAAAAARQLRDQYTIELAQLLGITLVPMASETPAEATALPEATATP